MKKTITHIALLIFLFAISSCGIFNGAFKDSGYKNVSYYQNLDHKGTSEEQINNYTPFKIQTGDILGINVNSVGGTDAATAAAVFNTTSIKTNTNEPNAVNPVFGFRVDANGSVQLPYVGDMKVAGMTTDEVAKKLTENLQPYLKSPVVNVRVLNFKVSVSHQMFILNFFDKLIKVFGFLILEVS